MATFQVKEMASVYTSYRPKYPDNLKDEIFNFAKGNPDFTPNLAVDLCCGGGQSTAMWANDFKQVLGFDISKAQLDNAPKHLNNVKFAIGSVENVDLEDNSADLVTVGQAMHWIDPEKTYAEAKRVLKPGGAFAIYAYGNPYFNKPEADQIVMEEFYTGKLYEGGYWEDNRKHIDDCYEKFTPLPFEEFKRVDTVNIQVKWPVEHFIGYLSSWSAYRTFIKQNPKSKELQEIKKSLRNVYKDDEPIGVTWPIFLLMGRKA